MCPSPCRDFSGKQDRGKKKKKKKTFPNEIYILAKRYARISK